MIGSLIKDAIRKDNFVVEIADGDGDCGKDEDGNNADDVLMIMHIMPPPPPPLPQMMIKMMI